MVNHCSEKCFLICDVGIILHSVCARVCVYVCVCVCEREREKERERERERERETFMK